MSGEDVDSEMDFSGEDEYSDYYGETDDCDGQIDDNKDPEHFMYQCLSIEKVEQLLNESVEQLCNSIEVAPSLAKLLLHTRDWDVNDIIQKYKRDSNSILAETKLKPFNSPERRKKLCVNIQCIICMDYFPSNSFCSLTCGHWFCKDCWTVYLEVKISECITTNINCMAQDCNILVPEDVVFSLVTKPNLRDKYQQFTFHDHVKSHPELRFCPGINCQSVIQAKEVTPKCVTCKFCKTSFCFKCGSEYHAPLDCAMLKTWLAKCSDDSETANYICAHTKDCPKCQVCIEKNGGCNHMHCSKCKYDFCWMCLGDWKTHDAQHYQCSRYQENPEEAEHSASARAREALKKYLHYFQRWENHSNSLKLEEQTLLRIKTRMHDKVMHSCGTWIDWQYLIDAAALLAKCRYTLQYTYPYAFYMEAGPRKALFEYQQAQLETAIENLSWKVERAETTDRGDIENQMAVAGNQRVALLKDFFC